MDFSLDRDARKLGADEKNLGLFWARFGRAKQFLDTGLRSLYGKVAAETVLPRLNELLLREYRARPGELRARDAEGEAAGPWYLKPGLAACMLYLDRFAGDFKGFEKRLPWLEELGINLVHLMPFMKSPQGPNDGGYAVSDYLGVDPRFGSDRDLAATAGLLHKKGMYLAADLVLNHSSDEHPWAVAAREGDPVYRNYYYVFPDRTQIDRYEAAMPEVFPATAPGNFTYVEGLGWVMTVFNSYQWDLNWRNPEVFLEMLAIVLGMANQGIDLLRLDAVPYLWKVPGTSCQNLDEAHAIVGLLKAAAGVVAPGLAFLAEAIVQPSEIVKYLDADDGRGAVREECQLAYHASLMALLWEALATRQSSLLSSSFGAETRLARGTAWLSYARCHDDIGLGYDDALIRRLGHDPSRHRRFIIDWYTGKFPGSLATGRPFMENPETGDARISGSCASLCGLEGALETGDEGAIEFALRRIELLHALTTSLIGIPMIFSGDEIASPNDYSWEGSQLHADDNRWMHRPHLDWKRAARARKGLGPEGRILSFIAACLARRRTIEAFAPDASFEVLPAGQHVLLVRREAKAASAKPVLVAANFSEAAQEFLVPMDGEAGDLVFDELLRATTIPAARGRIRLEPLSVLWLSQR